MLTRTQAALILNGIPGVGPIACRRLLDAFGGDLVAVISAEKSRLRSVPGIGAALGERIAEWRFAFDLDKEERALAASGAKFVPFFDEAFPPLLKEIADPPIGLYVRGNAEALASERTVGVVGTRRASLYGTTNARKISRELAAAGQVVVSGGARGIDTAAHTGALEAPGATVAVLGCGLDVVYPPENLELFSRIARSGGAVVSEFPFGKKADRRTFPQRNRIIAGMSAGVLVVESDVVGGSIITANFAAECGRTVFALPGRVEQSGSRGCHKLIREGATLAACAADILEDLAGTPVQQMLALENACAEERGGNDADSVSPEARKILSVLGEGEALSPDALSERAGIPFPLVSANLLLLELDGRVARKTDGTYESRS